MLLLRWCRSCRLHWTNKTSSDPLAALHFAILEAELDERTLRRLSRMCRRATASGPKGPSSRLARSDSTVALCFALPGGRASPPDYEFAIWAVLVVPDAPDHVDPAPPEDTASLDHVVALHFAIPGGQTLRHATKKDPQNAPKICVPPWAGGSLCSSFPSREAAEGNLPSSPPALPLEDTVESISLHIARLFSELCMLCMRSVQSVLHLCTVHSLHCRLVCFRECASREIAHSLCRRARPVLGSAPFCGGHDLYPALG